MSTVITAGEIAAAAGDAYGASQGDGGLSSPANQASFGAAIKAALTGIAIAASSAQLAVQLNSSAVNGLINDLVNNWNSLLNDLGDFFGDLFNRAKNWVWPRDPIILDLDGNGLETVGLASNVYFDHDGDGVLTRTVWADTSGMAETLDELTSSNYIVKYDASPMTWEEKHAVNDAVFEMQSVR
jgi:hypothetical protein